MTDFGILEEIDNSDFREHRGTITHVSETRIEARGPQAQLGDYCQIENGKKPVLAEVVAIHPDKIVLLPLTHGSSIKPGARVTIARNLSWNRVGGGYAGRIVDGFGQPLDGKGNIANAVPADRKPALPPVLDRITPHQAIATGIRAIDALLPIGEGQRIGIFAASGVGKTSLIEQLSEQIACDHVIMCLVGERGREVHAIWQKHCNANFPAPITVVAATSDESASMRIRAVEQALALAEHWRAQNKHVVLFVDSVTRLALALRELGLAAGEPPSIRGLTPNVFTFIPQIVERCGATGNAGAITAIFTVLSETDDVDDPIVELMKSLLDGHIILSRKLADKGHFPAIDVNSSISRLETKILAPANLSVARRVRWLMSKHAEAKMMIDSGIYRSGSNAEIDLAIKAAPSSRNS